MVIGLVKYNYTSLIRVNCHFGRNAAERKCVSVYFITNIQPVIVSWQFASYAIPCTSKVSKSQSVAYYTSK